MALCDLSQRDAELVENDPACLSCVLRQMNRSRAHSDIAISRNRRIALPRTNLSVASSNFSDRPLDTLVFALARAKLQSLLGSDIELLLN